MEYYEYASKFKTLIARERNAEIDLHTAEINSLPGYIREKKGRAITQLSVQPNNKLEADSIFRFVKTNGYDMPHTEISVGSNVLISTSKNPMDNHIRGVVVRRGMSSMDIHVLSQSRILSSDRIRIDLYVNDVTYQVQKKILENMKDWSGFNNNLKEVLLHNMKPRLGDMQSVNFLDRSLNDSQRLAVNYAVREKDLYLIQGPPGTGKTKTSIEIVRQHLKKSSKVLVCADSNMAVDNIMMSLLSHTEVIRIGESPKILPAIQEHTFSNLMKCDFKYKFLNQALTKVQTLKSKQRSYIHPSKKNSKGLSHFQIRKLAERGQSDFGVSLKDMQSMAHWIVLQEEIKILFSKVDKVRKEIIKHILAKASVICTTNTNAAHQYLDGMEFDLVLIDEAGQSTEPSCLIPIAKAKKVILVGDHKQLPPTILSPDAQDFSLSLFERMMTNSRYTLLDHQYRMHPLINAFPSKEFYNGKLLDAPSTKLNRLTKDPFGKQIVFIECFGEETKKKGAKSYYNEKEADIVFDLILSYKKQGLFKEDIGIISPYNGQVKVLKDKMPFLEVNSIDGFQGREKKIIIMSLVRSNSKENIGFLNDLRRLNVALTRATTQLIVVGNPKTITSHEVYGRLLTYIKQKGMYVSDGELLKIIY